jgi:heme O synthase-like polyprenyltransferase
VYANRYVDIDIDEAMKRVELRHVATGKCSLPEPNFHFL